MYCQVTTKLILKKNNETGNYIYFVAKMGGWNAGKSIKDINYTNNRSFTGHIFISDLNDLCIGIYNCNSGIIRRAEFAKSKTKSANNDENIDGAIVRMFATPLAAYNFGENSCPEDCWYCDNAGVPCSDCNSCTPAIVDICSVCGAQNSCYCCFVCHRRPCVCKPDYGCPPCGSYSCS